MLHVILQILAVIGIILACILGLLLFLLLLVLFVPVRYRIDGTKDADSFALSVKASYLLHIVSLRYQLPAPGKVIVKLFGRKIMVIPGEDEELDSGQENAPDTVPQKQADGQDGGGNATQQAVTSNVKQDEANSNVPSEETDEMPDAEEQKTSWRHPIQWVKAKIQKCIYTIRTICDKIKKIAENISYYRDVLTANENRLFYRRVMNRLMKVLKSIRPRVLKADLRLGTGSPDTTGYLCGVYGMLLPVLGKHVAMTPDFEEAVYEGTFLAKGRITLFTILLQAGKIFFDKQLRVFLKELKREES